MGSNTELAVVVSSPGHGGWLGRDDPRRGPCRIVAKEHYARATRISGRRSKTLIDALITAIEAKGGRIHLGCPAQQVRAANNCVVGVQTKHTYFAAAHVVLTIPTPNISRLVPDLPEESRVRYDALKTIGICCVVLKLRSSDSPHFWVNLGQTAHEIPRVIEFSNLRDMSAVVVYVPYCIPTTTEVQLDRPGACSGCIWLPG